jgi:uncharacterized membrane protein YbhN (UPF0104 family)
MPAPIELNPRRAGALLVVGLGLAGLAVASLGVDRSALTAALARWDPALLPAIAACFIGTLLARSLRAWALLPPGVAPRELVAVVAFAFLPTLLAPGKLGVLVRPALLRARIGTPVGVAIAGAVAERLIDLGVLLGLAAALFGVGTGMLGWGLVGAGALAGVAWLLRVRLGAMLIWAGVRLDGGPPAPLRLAAIAAGTVGFWAAGIGAAALVLQGMGVEEPLLRGAALTAAGSAAAVGVPVPGAVGVFESAGTAALAGLGVDAETGLACALVLHIAQLATNTLLAAFGASWLVVVPPIVGAQGDGVAEVDPSH